MTRTSIAVALAGALLAAVPAVARAEVPVRVRVIKGSRQGPASVDPRLSDLKRQLSPLAYVKWEQVDEKAFDLTRGTPDGRRSRPTRPSRPRGLAT